MGPVPGRGPRSLTPRQCSVNVSGGSDSSGGWPRMMAFESAESQVCTEEVKPSESGPHGPV